MTETVSSRGRKPKLAAKGDEPSRISAAPTRTLFRQSAAAGVPGGATKMSACAAGAAMWPTEERIAGHDPARGPRIANVPATPCGAIRRASRRLFRKCIPDTRAKVVEIGSPRISRVDQIDPAHRRNCDRERRRRIGQMNAEARPRFREARPVLPFGVECKVAAPESLRPGTRQGRRVAHPVLRIVDQVVVEAADKDAVSQGFEKPATLFRCQRSADGTGV